MLIRMKKVPDGVVLSCVRAGASAAVQGSGHSGFFTMHDLMHFAVETTLGFNRAFFGLMAEGWTFETFGNREDPRRRQIPAEAIWSEHIVGILMRESRDVAGDADLVEALTEELNRELRSELAKAGVLPYVVGAAKIGEVLRAYQDLEHRWRQLPTGEHLELGFCGAG